MSNLSPFDSAKIEKSVLPLSPGVFKPDLAHFDFDAYIQRQIKIDEFLREGAGRALTDFIVSLDEDDYEVGVKLNNLHNTVLEGRIPSGLNASLAVFSKSNIKSDFVGVIASGSVAPEADFSGINARSTDFTNAVMPRADFRGTDLTGSIFTNAVLSEAKFDDETKIHGADFRGAYLAGSEGLTHLDIASASFNSARTVILENSEDINIYDQLVSHFGLQGDFAEIIKHLEAVPISYNQIVPRMMTRRIFRGLVAQGLVINDVDFTASDFVGSNMNRVNGKRVVLREASLSGSIITDADFTDADMHGTWAPGIVVEEASFRGANFGKSNLVGAVLRGVDLRAAINLETANTNGIVLDDCKLPKYLGYDGVELTSVKKELE